MKDMRTVRANEKVKRLSTLAGNASLALFITALSRWYGGGLDLIGVLWILIAAALTWVSVQINELLDSEDQ